MEGYFYQQNKFTFSKIQNWVIKYIFLFFLYLSYISIIISISLILLEGNEEKDKLIDYITNEGNTTILAILIVLAKKYIFSIIRFQPIKSIIVHKEEILIYLSISPEVFFIFSLFGISFLSLIKTAILDYYIFRFGLWLHLLLSLWLESLLNGSIFCVEEGKINYKYGRNPL